MRPPVLVAAVALACASGGVHADLYLWKDPATGAVKIYSYPPPWYGNPDLERRSPKVERIPERQRSPVVQPQSAALAVPVSPETKPVPAGPGAPPAPPGTGASSRGLASALLGPLEAQRKRLLGEMAAMREGKDPGLARQLEGYRALVEQMDRIDPAGAESRLVELRALIERTR